MSDLMKTSDFDPLVPWIREMRPADRFIKIQLPSTFVTDADQIMAFLDDANINFERNRDAIQRWVTGIVRDPLLFDYLNNKWHTSGEYAFEYIMSYPNEDTVFPQNAKVLPPKDNKIPTNP